MKSLITSSRSWSKPTQSLLCWREPGQAGYTPVPALAGLGVYPRGAWAPPDCTSKENQAFTLLQVLLPDCAAHREVLRDSHKVRGLGALTAWCGAQKEQPAAFNTCWLLRAQFLVLCLRLEVTPLLMPWVTSSTLKLSLGLSWGPRVNQWEVTSSYTDNERQAHETPVTFTTSFAWTAGFTIINSLTLIH